MRSTTVTVQLAITTIIAATKKIIIATVAAARIERIQVITVEIEIEMWVIINRQLIVIAVNLAAVIEKLITISFITVK